MLRFFELKGGIFILLFLFLGNFTSAWSQRQTQQSPYFSHSLSFAPSQKNSFESAVGTYKIIAVMVDFQPDSNRFTSGDGTFFLDYLDNDDVFVDPLPHDQSYFESHLQFAKNYFSTVSSGQVDLDFEVIPQVFTLSKKMEAYSPLDDEENGNQKLADLVRETWELVGQSGVITSDKILPQRTAFVIFHAGVGRDIELLGTTLDKTPQDIPSLTLNSNGIERLFPFSNGELTISGIPAAITNTLILPATQSRQGSNIDDSKFILQLSTNGLICASIGSFLGLPDLFNTEDGQSAIGQFGLMDGAGFFANFGLFPPEPSAWEKQYLGWISPPEIDTKMEQTIPLNHVSGRNGQTTVKIPIDEFEYYLVENRHRDPDGSGVTLTIRTAIEGDKSVTYTNFDEYFRFFDTDSLKLDYPPGVLISVSNYDWALPGGLDYGEDGRRGNGDDRLLNGGILIWHIDEAVIQIGLEDNTINNDPLRRGVDLEEADGAQDIGLPNAVTEISGIQNGSPFDFWWSGNDARVILPSGLEIQLYENRFGDDTTPNNRTNSGLSVGFEMFDFSDNVPEATFSIRPTQQNYPAPIVDIQVFDHATGYSSSVSPSLLVVGPDSLILIPTSQGIYSVTISDVPETIVAFPSRTPSQPFLLPDGFIVDDLETESLRRYRYTSGEWTTVWTANNAAGVGNGSLLNLASETQIFIPKTGNVIHIESGEIETGNPEYGIGARLSDIHTDQFILNGSRFTEVESGREGRGPTSFFFGSIGLLKHSPSSYQYLVTEPIQSFLVQPFENTFKIIRLPSRDATQHPTLYDANDDGNVDIILTQYNQLLVVNREGTVVSRGEFRIPSSSTFVSGALVYKTNDNEKHWIATVWSNQRFRVMSGRLLGGNNEITFEADAFVGSLNSVLAMEPIIVGDKYIIISPTGRMLGWKIPSFNEALVSAVKGDVSKNTFQASGVTGGGIDLGERLLVDSETYNWPNPADFSTQIRFQTQEPAHIEVVVFSMSGGIVKRLEATSDGNAAQEITLDTSNLGSGIYLARVTAKSNSSGKSDTKIIRIAVIH